MPPTLLTTRPSAKNQPRHKPKHKPAKLPSVLPAASHHLVSRFSYGVTPALTAAVQKAGGASAWFTAQLSPASIADAAADRLVGWWDGLGLSPQQLWQRQLSETQSGWDAMADYQRWLLLRRITTNRQLAEVMTEFWMNHLHVPVHYDTSFTYRFDYDRVVRAGALGRFTDLLQAAIVHPAMGMFLDNAVSTKDHPNENLGRELLELHTVGRGHYTEDDVKGSARILTGYLVDEWDTWKATYSAADHWTGPVTVMGFSNANQGRDGRAVTAAYLDYLAHHRGTAERIAGKLATKFVSDTPSAALVDHLADVYLANDTAIVPVLRALVASTEFKTAPPKVRDPGEDVVATYRALQVKVGPPAGGDDDGSAATSILWQTSDLGAMPHDWPRPDGPPLDSASWCSPARLMASTRLHWSMSGGWWPTQGITYRTPVQWLPQPRVRFDRLVDHLSRQLLGKASTPVLLKACTQACEVDADTVIDKDSGTVKWNFHRLLSTILDSPDHLSR